MSVILDLKIEPRKLEMINAIIQCLYERKLYLTALLALERIKNETEKIQINTTILEEERINETLECPICLDAFSLEATYETNCRHSFCVECTTTHLKKDTHNKCPMCRTKITALEQKKLNPSNENLVPRELLL